MLLIVSGRGKFVTAHRMTALDAPNYTLMTDMHRQTCLLGQHAKNCILAVPDTERMPLS